MSWLKLVLICGALGALSCSAAEAAGSGRDACLAPAEKTHVVRALSDSLQRNYVFPDVARRLGIELQRREGAGAYASHCAPDEFAAAVTRDLRTLGHDRHLELGYSAAALPSDSDPEAPPPPQARAAMRTMGERRNFGFSSAEILPGDIGYLKIDGFFDPDVGGGETLAAALTFLGHTHALILDLRDNGGGFPTMEALVVSHLLRDRVHLADFRRRDRQAPESLWTQPQSELVYKGPVYVLVSHDTVSAGEALAYDLQALKRGQVVGEVTAGGANPGMDRRLTEHFSAFIPFGQAVSAITGSNWEGVGVRPDVACPAKDALTAAERLALTAALVTEKDPAETKRLASALAALPRGEM